VVEASIVSDGFLLVGVARRKKRKEKQARDLTHLEGKSRDLRQGRMVQSGRGTGEKMGKGERRANPSARVEDIQWSELEKWRASEQDVYWRYTLRK